ncbi:hypothetical protein H0H92_007785 [Tricholoma furcatifolium]|nr:hypothetical protein H0H92_007785 [Tricholoma furcatifolium]
MPSFAANLSHAVDLALENACKVGLPPLRAGFPKPGAFKPANIDPAKDAADIGDRYREAISVFACELAGILNDKEEAWDVLSDDDRKIIEEMRQRFPRMAVWQMYFPAQKTEYALQSIDRLAKLDAFPGVVNLTRLDGLDTVDVPLSPSPDAFNNCMEYHGTLFVSDFFEVAKCKDPAYAHIQIGLMIAIFEDIRDRTRQLVMKEAEEKPKKRKRRDSDQSNRRPRTRASMALERL